MAIKDLATCRLIDFTAMLHTAHLSTGYIRPSSPAFTHGQSLGRNQERGGVSEIKNRTTRGMGSWAGNAERPHAFAPLQLQITFKLYDFDKRDIQKFPISSCAALQVPSP